jgi:hypothetical protein
MEMRIGELDAAMRLAGLTNPQCAAVEAVGCEVERSPELKRMAEEDCARLSDVRGSDALKLGETQLKEMFGENAGMYPVLILLSRVGWLKDQYAQLDIDSQVLVDTLSDIPLWIENHYRRTGELGLVEYPWLVNHMRMRLFRLGRLEYIYTKSRVPARFYRHKDNGKVAVLADGGLRYDGAGALTDAADAFVTKFEATANAVLGNPIDEAGVIDKERVALPLEEWSLALAPKDPVLDVHIPEGPPLTPEWIAESLAAAPKFFAEKRGVLDARAFTCGSWLMSPALKKIAPGSNLAAFQALFRVAPYTTRDSQVFERVYGRSRTEWEALPMKTRLQRGVRDWYLAGGNCRQMQGVILLRSV